MKCRQCKRDMEMIAQTISSQKAETRYQCRCGLHVTETCEYTYEYAGESATTAETNMRFEVSSNE